MPYASFVMNGTIYQTDGSTAYSGVYVKAINRSNQGETDVYTDSSGQYTLDAMNFTNAAGTAVGYLNGDSVDFIARTAGYRASGTITIDTVAGSPKTTNMTVSVSVTYTTADRVANFLQVNNFPENSTTGSNPVTYMRVEDLINRMEERIERETNHAWRAVTVTNEWYSVPNRYIWGSGTPIYLKHRKIRTFTSGTDKLELWDGSSYVEWVANKTNSRATGDYWVEYETGIIWLKNPPTYHNRASVRMTYRYGETTVPKDIEHACTLLVAIELLMMDDRSNMLVAGTNLMFNSQKIGLWKQEVAEILDSRREIAVAIPNV